MDFYESPAYSELCKRIYGIDLKQMSLVTMSELELFFKEIQLSPGSKILDLGCSAGHFADYISKRYNSHVTGIDITKNRINYAMTNFAGNINLDFQEMDFNELVFEPASFDLVYSFDSMYFTRTVEKIRALLDKCMDILKPGGKLAVFWSTNPSGYNPEFYAMTEPYQEYTQVGLWGTLMKIDYWTFDLTTQMREFYIRALRECHILREQLEDEIPEVYKAIENEFSFSADLCAKGDAGGMYRWLYIFLKP